MISLRNLPMSLVGTHNKGLKKHDRFYVFYFKNILENVSREMINDIDFHKKGNFTIEVNNFHFTLDFLTFLSFFVLPIMPHIQQTISCWDSAKQSFKTGLTYTN
jgi:hypothetical protein